MPCPALTAGTHPSTPAAAIPDWLPAWSNQTALQLNLAAACSLKPLPRAYANATLCVNDQKSPLLAAALGGGLAGPGSCGGSCVYNPAPLDGDTAVTAWRWDTDNVCWMQDTRNVQSCPLDASSSAASIARWAAGSMQRDKQLVDWLALPALNEAWAAYQSAGSGPALEDDPTGALAHEAFFLELVDALASSAAATKLAALPAGDPIAAMQAKLVEEFRCVAVPACWLAGVLPGCLAGWLPHSWSIVRVSVRGRHLVQQAHQLPGWEPCGVVPCCAVWCHHARHSRWLCAPGCSCLYCFLLRVNKDCQTHQRHTPHPPPASCPPSPDPPPLLAPPLQG